MCYTTMNTDSQNTDFLSLIKLLDEDLSKRYGSLQEQYTDYNKVDFIQDVVIVYKDSSAVSCGAYKPYDKESVELKRIFVRKEMRGQGCGKLVIERLEELAKARGYKYAVLETGVKQHEAIALYKKLGYAVIQNYGPYNGNTNSVCMKKAL